jgi:hypothetical protein
MWLQMFGCRHNSQKLILKKYGSMAFPLCEATFRNVFVATLKMDIATCGKWRQGWATLV